MNEKTIGKIISKQKNLDIQLNNFNEESFKREYEAIWDNDGDNDDEEDWEDEIYND